MKVRLNKRTIDEAVYRGPGGCYLWDLQQPGFGVRIYPTGAKSFVVSYWINGRRRFYTLGRYGRITLPQAREAALEVFLQVHRGEDPSANRQAAHQAPTVADLAVRHIKDHARINNKPRSVKRARQLWDSSILPKLAKRRVKDVQRADIARLVADMADRPAMANKVISLLSKSFNLAEVWGWRSEGTNPCRHIQRFKEESRERYLSEQELGRLGEALTEAEQNWGTSPHAIAAIRLLILTGCRSAEILTLRWAEVDFERRCLHLSDSKTGKRTVMLNTAALKVLAGIERFDDNPYVIVGAKPGSHRSTLQNVWPQICREAQLEDVRCHDLRHTHASVGVNAGLNLPVIGKLLGHTKITTTQRYAHLADDPLRQASEQIGATLAASMSGQPKATVKEIRPARYLTLTKESA
ncbi:MAG: site-specific integrase, partial [Acidobacteriota bacterium]